MKTASLNLSVNAIVVFVLAFAMLGVGLMFTNMIRSKMTDTLGSITTVDDWKNPPTPETPLTLNDEIQIGQSAKKKIKIGFYNSEGSRVENVKVGIRKCKDTERNMYDIPSKLPMAMSIQADKVEAGEAQGFKFTLDMTQNLNGDSGWSGLAPEKSPYTCTFIAYDGSSGDPTDSGITIYEKKQFWLEVTG